MSYLENHWSEIRSSPGFQLPTGRAIILRHRITLVQIWHVLHERSLGFSIELAGLDIGTDNSPRCRLLCLPHETQRCFRRPTWYGPDAKIVSSCSESRGKSMRSLATICPLVRASASIFPVRPVLRVHSAAFSAFLGRVSAGEIRNTGHGGQSLIEHGLVTALCAGFSWVLKQEEMCSEIAGRFLSKTDPTVQIGARKRAFSGSWGVFPLYVVLSRVGHPS